MKAYSARSFAFARLSVALLTILSLWLLLVSAAGAATLQINVVGVAADGSQTPVTDYRWTVEEDATKLSVPGQAATKANYSFSFHTSYMPLVAAGRAGTAKTEVQTESRVDPDVQRLYDQALADLSPAKRYYVSITAQGYQMGGAPVVFDAGGNPSATVYLNQYPLPTAQVSVFVFNDNNPINGAPDLPQETGLAGFTVILNEAGGTYGQSGGAVTQDAFANPLGTTYGTCTAADVTAARHGCTVAGADWVERGTGIILTDADGVAVIKNLYPAKYTILVIPPNGSDWVQTSTIEGTKGIDAWVKNNEPSFFQEFGPPGHHVFIGFTKPGVLVPNVLTGSKTITGRVVDTHNSRPPVYTFYQSAPVANCWVGLNEPNGGRALYATACKKDSTFAIPNVPDGTYELVIWDEPLDVIIAATTICVGTGTGCQTTTTTGALGDLPVSSWFGRYQGRVFQDIDGTGLPFFAERFDRPYIYVDPVTGIEREDTRIYAAGELKPPFGEGIASNIRFRDGSIYQSTTTKKDGTFAFTEVFPFFNWMVGEIDYARFKATGATIVVDNGGEVKCRADDPDGPGCADARSRLWKSDKGLFGSNDPALAYDPWIRLNPQPQPCTPDDVNANKRADGSFILAQPRGCTAVGQFRAFRNENCAAGDGQCAILLEGMQTFLGQTNHVEWGKQPYNGTVNGQPGQNGGIAGIVHYAITRAEDDPRFAAAENWEPGIPRVQVNLFLDCDGDGRPDKPKYDGSGQCAALSSDTVAFPPSTTNPAGGYQYDPPDVDNYPFCWRAADEMGTQLCPNGTEKGPEDRKRSRTGGASFSYGDVFRWGGPGVADPVQQPEIGLGKTDAWDDSVPTDCVDATPYQVPSTGEALDCFDGLRNYNQVRPSVFDGGYAFGRVAGQPELPMFIGAEGKGTYIVEAVAPPGYLHQGNGDKNVVFGDELKASTAALPFECVGMELPVPPKLTLFPGEDNPNYLAGQRTWRKCDMKAVPLLPGANPAPDFYMFTEAPVAGHGVGFILDDTAAEFNHFAPNFGEKYSPPHLPVSVKDWTGREISRVYSDQFGSYNFLVPSTFTINPPYPSGVMPSMMVACMNDPGPITRDPVTGAPYVGPNGVVTPQLDPFYNRRYTTFCYTLQYLPGKTTYLDTPVLPIAAFAPVDKNPLDCECADGTPGIFSVNNGIDNGPWIPLSINPVDRRLTIISQGKVDVVNPAYDGSVVYVATVPPPASQVPGVTYTTNPSDPRLQKTIKRDYGFGSRQGTVRLGNTSLTINSWSDGVIVATVPVLGASTGQLAIVRGDNRKESVVGITVHVATLTSAAPPIKVNPNAQSGSGVFKTIQAAIDSVTEARVLASPLLGTPLITIAPGTYNEYVIMDKRVHLQGWGAGSVVINAAKSNAGGLAAWRTSVNARANTTFTLLPGQTLGTNAANNEPLLFGAEEGPGILAVGRQGLGGGGGLLSECLLGTAADMSIDGLTVTGSDAGGGILASGYACGLEVSNNRIVGNYGTYGGGIRIGHTALLAPDNTYTDAVNRGPNIHHNWVSQNGATEAGGSGGITLGTGSSQYTVQSNYVCGNFSMADGGGLSHLGVSAGSIGANGARGTANWIAGNQFLFNQTFNQSADPTGGGLFIGGQIPVGGGASDGTGDVIVDGNVFQGNQAGAGAGGAISVARTATGNDITLTNNIVANNVAAYAGGGIALIDTAAGVRLVNNTVASNASTATNRQAFGPQGVNAPSLPQVAGVAVLGGASPTMLNNVFWANRQYIYLINGTTTGLCNPGATAISSAGCAPAGSPTYADLGRVRGTGALVPRYSVFTDTAPNHTAFDAGVAGCSNTAPTTGTGTLCNRFVAATSTSLFARASGFQSIIDPTQPVQLADATVNLQSALTFDETGNFINVIFSPLTMWDLAGSGALRADYHLGAGSVAINNGRARNTTTTGNNVAIGANFVPTADIDGASRPAAIDIGADEFAQSVHVGDLDRSATATGTTWSVTVTVTVHNSSHAAVSGALVSFAWAGGGSGGTSCTTGAAGTCQVTRTGLSGSSVTATVSNVAGTYQAPANHDPDAPPQDSNGSSITVARP